MELDAVDPLDPLEAAPARDDEPARRTVAVAQRLVADVRGQEQAARVLEAEAPAVAGPRDHAHVRDLRRGARLVEQPSEPHAAPALGRVEAAGAVERRDELVAAVELRCAQREPPVARRAPSRPHPAAAAGPPPRTSPERRCR